MPSGACSTTSRFKAKEVVASLSGNSVIVKKITLPDHDRAGAGGVDLLGSRAVHPVRHPGRQPRLRDPRRRPAERQGTMDVLLVAAKKDKIADYTSVITQAGRTPVVVDVDAFALQNAYEVNYGFEPGGVVALLNAGASAININILSGAQSVFTRDISHGRQRLHRGRPEGARPAVRQLAEQLKKGEDGRRRRHLRRCRPVLKAMTDNMLLESREDVRLLQGHGRERPDRPHRAERRRLARRRLRGSAGRALRHGSRAVRSRSARSPSTRRSFGVASADDLAPVAAIAVGLALRKAGDR